MALEDLTGSGKYIDDLVSTNPTATDNVHQGDDHIRGIKNVLKLTFPSIDGAINATDTELNYVDGVTSAIQTQLDAPVAKGDGSSADGQITLNCSQNSHGIKLKSPPHSANASYTLTFPNDDGNSGQKLTTDGSGVLTWTADNATDSTKMPLAGGAFSGAVTTNSTIDGRDVAADGVLATNALPKSGGTMTGDLTMTNAADNKPHLLLRNDHNADTDDAPIIELYQNDTTTGGIADDTDVGVIRFSGDEKDGGTKEIYSEIRGVAHDAGQGTSNKGNLSFFVQTAGSLFETLTLDESTVKVTGNAVGTLTTDNDGSFAMSASNNFKCTPGGNFALTFTAIVAQSGNILFINSGGHTISAHANTKVDANLLATISTAGTYLLAYFSDGTNVYMTNSAAYA